MEAMVRRTALVKTYLAVFILLIGGNFLAEPANAQGRLFECDIKEVMSWRAGRFEESAIAEVWLKEDKKLYFDEASGLMRYFGVSIQFKNLKQAVLPMQNDLIALRDIQGSGSRDVKIFRISTWENHMPFFYDPGSLPIVTGTCRVVG